ncbi:hypothetical protein G9A89_019148 [Geosiphon pyriformis]|nr:hypothetical protein G9A89_019148 [Geosiphon pyriformis]
MSSTSSIENATPLLDWLEGTLFVFKESLAFFPVGKYSKVAELVKKYLERNQKKPEDLFNHLKNKNSKHSIDHILLGFSLEHGIGTIPNLKKAFLEYQKAANAKDSFGQFFSGHCYLDGIGTSQDRGKAFELYSKAAEARNLDAQNNLPLCYLNGRGTTEDSEKAFELYSKAAEAGHLDAQNNLASSAEAGHLEAKYNLASCYVDGLGTTINEGKAFELYSKAAEAGDLLGQIALRVYHRTRLEITEDLEKEGNPSPQYWNVSSKGMGNRTTKNIQKAFELYLKAAGANNLCYQSDFLELNALDFTLQDQNNLEHFILRFQSRGLKCPDNSKGELLDFEAFFDQLSDEFKCFKCGNLYTIISGYPICAFCDTDKSENNDNNVFEAGLPKCPECYRRLKDPLWCRSCESSRFSNLWGTWNSENNNIDSYIYHSQSISESSRSCLEWISPDEIKFLEMVGTGGFGVVKEGTWERGKILFWDREKQKYERTGVTRVALKCLNNSQNIEYVNSIELIAHLRCASCKYILQCYGITKDITTNKFVMVLPFAEHGDLRAFLKLNEDIFTWDVFLHILFQITGGLRFIHESGLVHGDLHPGNILILKTNPLKVVISDLGFCRRADYSPRSSNIYGVLEYLAPEICKGDPHTKCSDIYSFAIISCEIISGERPLNNTDPIHVRSDVINGQRPIIKKHTPQCIQEMIKKNWQYDPSCRDSAEELQRTVIAARDNCDLNQPIREKSLESEETQDTIRDMARYRSRLITKSGFSTNEEESQRALSQRHPESSTKKDGKANYKDSNIVYQSDKSTNKTLNDWNSFLMGLENGSSVFKNCKHPNFWKSENLSCLETGIVIQPDKILQASKSTLRIRSAKLEFNDSKRLALHISPNNSESFLLSSHLQQESSNLNQSSPIKIFESFQSNLHSQKLYHPLFDLSPTSDVFCEFSFEKARFTLMPNDIEVSPELISKVGDALDDMHPFEEFNEIFKTYGHWWCKKFVLGDKLRRIVRNPAKSDRNSNRDEFTFEKVDGDDRVKEALKKWETLIVPFDSSYLMTLDGYPNDIRNVSDWPQIDSEWRIIDRTIAPLYELFELNQQERFNDLCKPEERILMQGSEALNDIEKEYKRILFERPLKSTQYQLFGSITSQSGPVNEHGLQILFSLQDEFGFSVSWRLENYTNSDEQNAKKYHFNWFLIGVPSTIGYSNPKLREYKFFHGQSSEKYKIRESSLRISLPIEEPLRPTNESAAMEYSLALNLRYPMIGKSPEFSIAYRSWDTKSLNLEIQRRVECEKFSLESENEALNLNVHWCFIKSRYFGKVYGFRTLE